MRDRKADNLVRKQLRLEQCAWANRRALTPSEARLWSALKARQLGVQFRREVPLAGRYIVDFFARLRWGSWLRWMARVMRRGHGRMRGGMPSFAGLGIACCGSKQSS